MREPALDIARLHEAYASGLDPVSVVRSVFDRTAAADDPGIFITLEDRERALAAARGLGPFEPQARPLWGVPFAVKDNIDCAGLPTTAGCPDFAYTPSEDAAAVALLRRAGAILIGKTNLDQFATGLVGVRTPYPVPRNAIDPELIPGGSSSGSAVSVARGLVSFSLGTDTAGSGRVPAALNNIVGLKPSLGAVSTRGVVPACRTLDCVSVFALTVGDAWRVLDAIAKYDAADPFSRPLVLGTPSLPPAVRVGVPDKGSRRFFQDSQAASAFESGLALLGKLGLATVEVDLGPFFEAADLLYAGPWVAERYQAIRVFVEERPASLHPVTRLIVEGARAHTAADAFVGHYRLAELKRAVAPVWHSIDVLAVPTIPTVYSRAQVERDPVETNTRLGTYTNFVNLLDLSALAVPGPFRSDGRPAGLTLIGERGRDALLAGLGQRLHAAADTPLGATGLQLPAAVAAPATAPPGWIELVVVGAHMSGLALNRELTDLGAVFLRRVATAPRYRLFALDGSKPHRPGLLWTGDDAGGVAIDAEVWALAPEPFGRFAAAIPAPLSLGRLRLADGSRPMGFLVEHAATIGARDISAYGGWRAYLAR